MIITILRSVLIVALVALVPAIAPDTASGADGFLQRIAAEHEGDAPSANVTAERAGLDTRSVDYATLGGQPVAGYMARPAEAEGPLPALIVIHEWWGLNEPVRAMTRRLAAAGYVALAVDLYGGRTAAEAQRARRLMQQAMARAERLEQNLRQAVYFLEVMPSTGRIGSIGWCFGGGWSLRTALLLPRVLDAAVIYYGRLVTDRDALAPLEVPLQGHFGADDGAIPLERVRSFERTLTALDKRHEIHVYEDAGHAFANPSGERYVEAAADLAWERTLAFLRRNLRHEAGGPEPTR